MKINDTGKKQFIAIIDKLNQLKASDYDAPNIRLSVAVLADDGKPRNWSIDSDEPKNSMGGLFCRLWAWNGSNGPSVIFSDYGPEISYGNLRQYEHAARACKLVASRLAKMYETRGNATDAADMLGRWLEATGITAVYCRHDGDNETWLNRGEWQTWTIGRTINEVRAKFPKIETAQAAMA